MVYGEIFPSLVTLVASSLALPLVDIYNCMSATTEWPDIWKMEYVTVISITQHRASKNDLKNISCTLLLSKVYESFLLSWIGEQVGIRANQFG